MVATARIGSLPGSGHSTAAAGLANSFAHLGRFRRLFRRQFVRPASARPPACIAPGIRPPGRAHSDHFSSLGGLRAGTGPGHRPGRRAAASGHRARFRPFARLPASAISGLYYFRRLRYSGFRFAGISLSMLNNRFPARSLPGQRFLSAPLSFHAVSTYYAPWARAQPG